MDGVGHPIFRVGPLDVSTRTLTGALLSGGGPRGEVEIDPMDRIRSEVTLNFACGTSIGAPNALPAMVGAPQDVARELWGSVKNTRDIMRIKDVNPLDGLYSLDPLIKLIKRSGLAGRRAVIPVWFGVVDAQDDNEHKLLRVDKLSEALRLDACRCTASIVPLPHEIAYFRGRVVTDGGERCVLPPVPAKLLPDVAELHAVFCSPIYPEQRRRQWEPDEVSTMLGLAMAKMEKLVSINVLADVERLRRYVARGIRVFVYAPQRFEDVGKTWDLSPEMRATRRATGAWMRDNRILLGATRDADRAA